MLGWKWQLACCLHSILVAPERRSISTYLMITMTEVQSCYIHTCLNHLTEGGYFPARWANGAYNLHFTWNSRIIS